MIDIRYEPGRRVNIRGHAGYAEIGKDIVCAAISTLYCTMIMSDGIGGVKEEDGMCAVCVDHNKGETFDLFCMGMKRVAEQYPLYVSFRQGKIDLDAY